MYTPRAFAETDLATLHQQIAATRLAILVTGSGPGLLASHLPLLLRPEQGAHGTLYGHLARANPQSQALAAGAEALVVFAGPDAYVSPSFYPGKAAHGKVVPTWNYLAVHAYGQPEAFDDPARLLELLGALTDRHEGGRAEPWKVSDAPADYLASQLRAIVGFALPIQRLEGKRKLSQNRDSADQAGVRQGLAASQDRNDQHLADLMR